MRRPFLAAFVVLTALAFPAVAEAQLGKRYRRTSDDWSGNLFLFAGQKILDEDDWEPIDEQLAFGVMADLGIPGWPVNLALDVFYSFNDDEVGGVDVSGDTLEFNLGVRKYFALTGDKEEGLSIFVGGGLCLAFASAEVDGESEDANGVGFWVDAGLIYTLGGGWTIGAEVGFTSADVEFEDADVEAEAGGIRYGVVLGFRW
jgi:opacity protein-like surface antigen